MIRIFFLHVCNAFIHTSYVFFGPATHFVDISCTFFFLRVLITYPLVTKIIVTNFFLVLYHKLLRSTIRMGAMIIKRFVLLWSLCIPCLFKSKIQPAIAHRISFYSTSYSHFTQLRMGVKCPRELLAKKIKLETSRGSKFPSLKTF